MPKLGDSQEFKDIANSLRDIASEAKNADKAVDDLGDGVKEALQALQKLGIVKDALKPTAREVEAARQAFAEFNSELSKEYKSVTQLIKTDKDYQKYLRGVVGETEALSNAQKKHKKATKEDTAAVKALGENMKSVLEQVQALKKAMDTGGINVKINNAGFTKVLDEMARAVDNFKRRKGNTGKNFFDAFTGSREENLETSQRVITDAKTLTDKLENVLGDSLTETLSKKLKDSISTGILKGVEMGVSRVQEIDPTAKLVGALLDETNASQPTKARVLQTMLGKKDETAIALERVKQNARARIEYRKIAADADVRRTTAVDTRIAEMEYVDANPNTNSGRMVAARARREEISEQREQIKLEQELSKIEREKTNRVRNRQEAVRIQKEMNEVLGEEGSKLQKLGQDLVSLNAKRREYLIQGDELNKINFAEVANNQRLITKKTQEWAAEAYKVEHHYYQIEKVGKALVNTLKFLSSTFQTTSATLSSLGGIWSTMRTSATQFFTFFTNSFRRVFSQAKSMALSLFKSGLEQRQKIEQAQIGFASFFGEDRVDAVTQAVRREAAKTPIVNAGDLADYVMQLAPVSQGNASLALNSSLGILKSLVYSGSDISEGEYVIKNIRDVIAKGTATAIDIRQFNRALPGLETAIKQMPDLANFIDENGKLSITKQNVGQVLDVFAKLNTDENSPLKQIEEKMLHTLDGMEKLFNEKKTTAMETILEKSGIFNLMYKALGLATDDGLWKKVADFVGNTLRPIVTRLSNILTNTNWGEIGKKLKEFWGIIKGGINDAKDAIFGAGKEVLGENPEHLFKRIANIIAALIRGIGNGVAEAMRFAKWLANMLSGGDLEKLAENIGKWLISPLGKIVQTVIGLGANSFGAASRALSTASKFVEMFNKVFLGGIAKNAVQYGQAYANMYSAGDAFGNRMTTTMLLNNSATSAADAAKYSGKTNITVLGGGSGSSVSSVSKLGKIGQSVSNVATTLKTFGAKLVGGLGKAALVGTIAQGVKNGLGQSDSSILGMISNGVTGAFTGSAILGAFSSVLGPVGAVMGGVLSVVIPYVQEQKRLAEEAKKRRTEEVINKLNEDKAGLVSKYIGIYNSQGGEVDTETSEGRYVQNQLAKWVQDHTIEDILNSPEKVLEIIAKSDKFAKMSERLAALDDTDVWKNAYNQGDIISNWDDPANQEIRHNLAEMAKKYKLLGEDAEVYDGPEEEIVQKLLENQNGGLSTEQYKMYMDEQQRAESDINTKTLNIYNKMVETKDEWSPMLNQIKTDASTIATNTGLIASNMNTNNTGDPAVDEWKKKFDTAVKNGEKFDIKSMFDLPTFGQENSRFSLNTPLSLNRVNQTPADIGIVGLDLYKNPSWGNLYQLLENKMNSLAEQAKNAEFGSDEYNNIKDKAQQLYQIGTEIKSLPDTADAYLQELEKLFYKYNWLFEAHGGFIANTIRKTIRPVFRAGGGDAKGVDTIPAMLSPGEFVMRSSAVSKAGLGVMNALNRGDMAAAARSLGARFTGSWNNSKNWSNTVNNNQKSIRNFINVNNRNASSRMNSYYGLANRIALAS